MSKQLVEDMAEWLYNFTATYVGYGRAWDELNKPSKDIWREDARQLIEKLRLVQLDTDQSLPQCHKSYNADFRAGYLLCSRDMENDRFEKVKE